MKKVVFKIFIIYGIVFLITSCSSVKPYERVYVNDPEMQMTSDSGKKFTTYVYSIREGATPAGTSKSSGGCGCN
jgi:Domain of unknown function (DUF4266)